MQAGERNELLSRQPNRFAQQLFDGFPARYDLLAELLSLGQNGRWRRAMVDAVAAASPTSVLDVATGPAGVALQFARRTGARVTGVDITDQMLRTGAANVARSPLAGRVDLLLARGSNFPSLTRRLTPSRSLTCCATSAPPPIPCRVGPSSEARRAHRQPRVPRANGEVVAPPLVALHQGGLARRRLPPGWARMVRGGRFLGPSISEHYRRYPVQWHVRAWSKPASRLSRSG